MVLFARTCRPKTTTLLGEATRGEKPDQFSIPKPSLLRDLTLEEPVIRLANASAGYDAQQAPPVLSELNLLVSRRSRIAVVGDNGAGKSTLLKLLLGTLAPLAGEVFVHSSARVAAVHQHHAQQLEEFLHLSPTQYLCQEHSCESDLTARSRLGRFGIAGKWALSPMKLLSGGQLARVSLTVCTMTDPHVIIMDEPTNHLDVFALDALATALNSFEGGVVLVSHNRGFCAAFCRDLWVVRGGTVSEMHSRTGDDGGEEGEQGAAHFAELFSTYEEQVMSSYGGGPKNSHASARRQNRLAKAAERLDSQPKAKGAKGAGVARTGLL